MTDKNVSIMNIGSMGYLPQVFKKIENVPRTLSSSAVPAMAVRSAF